MNIRNIFLAVLLSVSLPAFAQFRTIERAIEVALSDLQVPASTNGSLIFRECRDCDSLMIPMTRSTRFIVNEKDVGLKEFRKMVFRVQDREAETLVVMHHLESNTITSVSVVI